LRDEARAECLRAFGDRVFLLRGVFCTQACRIIGEAVTGSVRHFTHRKADDPTRLLVSMPTNEAVFDLVMMEVKQCVPVGDVTIRHAAGIISLPGGACQEVHYDLPAGCENAAVPPWTVLVSLEHGGALELRADDGAVHRVELDGGDLIAFRGDVLHAVVAYNDTHRRVHFYLGHEEKGTAAFGRYLWICP